MKTQSVENKFCKVFAINFVDRKSTDLIQNPTQDI